MGWLSFVAHRAAGTVVGRALSPFERLALRRFHDEPLAFPPVFVVGAPRTGSTILQEFITNYLDVAYLNNFMASYERTIYLAFKVSLWWYKDAPHNCFDSRFGKTWLHSMNAPHECGMLWRRWIPADVHFVDKGYLSEHAKREMRATATGIINTAMKPLVFKNLFMGQRLRMIKEVFGDAKFIFCRRDPLYTAQSILKVRVDALRDRDQWLSVRPREYDQLRDMSVEEQVVWSIHYLERQILEDLALFDADRCLDVQYEDLCREPQEQLERIRLFVEKGGAAVDYRASVPHEPLDTSNRQRIDDDTFARLETLVNSIDWTFAETV